MAPNGTKIDVYPEGDRLWIMVRALVRAIGYCKGNTYVRKKLIELINERGGAFAKKKIAFNQGTFPFLCDLREADLWAKAYLNSIAEKVCPVHKAEIERFCAWHNSLKDFEEYFNYTAAKKLPDKLKLMQVEVSECGFLSAPWQKEPMRFFVNSNGDYFISYRQLHLACGIEASGGCGWWGNSKRRHYISLITRAAIANGVTLYTHGSRKSSLIINVKDVEFLVEDFVTSDAMSKSRIRNAQKIYEQAPKFLDWWNANALPYLETLRADNAANLKAPEEIVLKKPDEPEGSAPATLPLKFIAAHSIESKRRFSLRGFSAKAAGVYADNICNYYIPAGWLALACGYVTSGSVIGTRLANAVGNMERPFYVAGEGTQKRYLLNYEDVEIVVREFLKFARQKYQVPTSKFLAWWENKGAPYIKKRQQELAAFEKICPRADTVADNEKEGTKMAENTSENFTVEDLKRITFTIRKLQEAQLPKDIAIRTAINLRANEVDKDLSVINEFVEVILK